MGVGGPMTICMFTKDADACCILCLSEWSVSLLFPWFKDNLTKANQYLVFWQDDLLGTAVTQNVNYFDLIKYFKDWSHRNVENVREERLFYLVCFSLFNLYESIILSCEFFWHSEGKISSILLHRSHLDANHPSFGRFWWKQKCPLGFLVDPCLLGFPWLPRYFKLCFGLFTPSQVKSWST